MPTKRAQIHFTLDKHDKNRLENILNKKYNTNITNIFRMIAKDIVTTKKIPFKYQPNQEIWRKNMAHKIASIAKNQPTEHVKTDKQGHVLNPKECPDFMNWMING